MQSPEMIRKMIKEQPGLKPYKQYLEWAYAIGYNHRSDVNGKAVLKLDGHGRVLAKYKNAEEAGRKNNLDGGNIRSCCRGRYNTICGYHWKHKT